MGAWVSLVLISSKETCYFSPQTKGISFLTSSFKGDARVEKLGTNLHRSQQAHENYGCP